MILRWREVLWSIAGAAIILACAALWLSQPVLAGECRGTMMVASYYGAESGSRTADGSFFDGSQMIAAHRSWRFGTKLRVTYRGRSVIVTLRDRGPFVRGRQLDISTAAARRIGMVKAGVGRVCVERL